MLPTKPQVANETPAAVVAENKIPAGGVMVDMTKPALKERFLLAQEDYANGTKSDQFRLAVARSVMDACGVKDKALRAWAVKILHSSHSSWGSNLSAFEQTTGLREVKNVDASGFTGEV